MRSWHNKEVADKITPVIEEAVVEAVVVEGTNLLLQILRHFIALTTPSLRITPLLNAIKTDVPLQDNTHQRIMPITLTKWPSHPTSLAYGHSFRTTIDGLVQV